MENPEIPAAVPVEPPKISYWRKLGGGSLTISIIVHAVVLILGLFWILQIIPPEKEKQVDFKPSGGGGGGSPKLQANKSQNRVTKAATQRVAAAGISSNFTLPDPEMSSSLKSLGNLGAASGGGGLGGGGSGGGKGEGIGRGIGDDMGDGMANGPLGKLSSVRMLS